jgi:hypothetical protein
MPQDQRVRWARGVGCRWLILSAPFAIRDLLCPVGLRLLLRFRFLYAAHCLNELGAWKRASKWFYRLGPSLDNPQPMLVVTRCNVGQRLETA